MSEMIKVGVSRESSRAQGVKVWNWYSTSAFTNGAALSMSFTLPSAVVSLFVKRL